MAEPVIKESYAAEEGGKTSSLLDESQIRWTPVVAQYLRVGMIERVITGAIIMGISFLPLILSHFLDWNLSPWINGGVPSLVFIVLVFDFCLFFFRARTLGYSEQPQHLLVKQGALFHKVMAVPYGRMQYVEVNAGPVARKFGLAELELHTAASNMTAKIVGITEAEAQRLRAVLTERGEEQMVEL